MCQIRGEEQRPTQAFLIIKVVKRGVVDRAEKELWEKLKKNQEEVMPGEWIIPRRRYWVVGSNALLTKFENDTGLSHHRPREEQPQFY